MGLAGGLATNGQLTGGGGSGTVTSVTAGNGTITIGGTAAAPTVAVGTGIPESSITNLTTDLAAKAPLASPSFTGTLSAVNIAVSGTTSFVAGSIANAALTTTPLIPSNNLSDVSSTTTALSNLAGAPLASPALTGNPTAPTQTALTNNTRIATTAYTDAAVAAGILGAPDLVSTTLGNGLNGATATISVAVNGDCAFMAVVAKVSETWKTIECFTGATFAGTNNTDMAIYSLNTSTGVLTLLWSRGAVTENVMWSTPGTSAHATTSINSGTGVAVTAGNIYVVGTYMANNADGFRGSNAQLSGGRMRAYNGLVCGKLAGQTNCPTASFNISTITAIGYTFLFNLLPY